MPAKKRSRAWLYWATRGPLSHERHYCIWATRRLAQAAAQPNEGDVVVRVRVTEVKRG